jgi:hypothetical protein
MQGSTSCGREPRLDESCISSNRVLLERPACLSGGLLRSGNRAQRIRARPLLSAVLRQHIRDSRHTFDGFFFINSGLPVRNRSVPLMNTIGGPLGHSRRTSRNAADC